MSLTYFVKVLNFVSLCADFALNRGVAGSDMFLNLLEKCDLPLERQFAA